LHILAEREPEPYAVTLKTGTNSTGLTKDGIKVYKVKAALFEEGIIEAKSPIGHMLRAYNAERTICDLVRSRRNVETILAEKLEMLLARGTANSRMRNFYDIFTIGNSCARC